MKCRNCKFWDRGWHDTESKPCTHPQIDQNAVNKGEPLVSYGADDDYGDYFRTFGEFGCILFEGKQE